MVREGRYAAIDIGTVTCRMLVADVREDACGRMQIQQLAKEYEVTNLGEGVDETRMLKPKALARVAAAIDGFLSTLAQFDTPENSVVDTLVMATSASRDAKNADEFAALLDSRGLRLQVISGDTEAMMSFIGASSAYVGESVAVVDVGGGSTEVSIGPAGDAPEWSHSFDIGCRRVTERFWDGYPPSTEAVKQSRCWIRQQLSAFMGRRIGRSENPSETEKRAEGPHIKARSEAHERSEQRSGDSGDLPNGFPTAKPLSLASRMLAVAGTATSAVSIRERMEAYDSERVNGATVTAEELRAIADDLLSKSLPELQHVVGLDPRRAPVIAAGMVILEEVMRALSAPAFTASESDILEGMIMYNAVERAKE